MYFKISNIFHSTKNWSIMNNYLTGCLTWVVGRSFAWFWQLFMSATWGMSAIFLGIQSSVCCMKDKINKHIIYNLLDDIIFDTTTTIIITLRRESLLLYTWNIVCVQSILVELVNEPVPPSSFAAEKTNTHKKLLVLGYVIGFVNW